MGLLVGLLCSGVVVWCVVWCCGVVSWYGVVVVFLCCGMLCCVVEWWCGGVVVLCGVFYFSRKLFVDYKNKL